MADSIRQQIIDTIDARFKTIVLLGSDSIRQQIMDAIDIRLRTLS
jgi:hypothetical protein